MEKSLKSISWLVNEEIYRADPAISYSTLAKYEREGFSKLPTLFDKVESPSLTFGSCVDSIITGGMEEFESRFFVCDFPKTDDSIVKVVDCICSDLDKEWFGDLYAMQDFVILGAVNELNYQPNWKPETRVKVVREKGNEYFMMKMAAGEKTVVNSELYTQVINCVNALKESDATSFYFREDNPFDETERLYQLKFKGEYDGIPIRCMLDEVIVNHAEKTIQPVDLKTSWKMEYDFPKSFIEWYYMYQCGMYSYILKQNIKEDPYFKDFKILDYVDIVVNKESCNPLVWKFSQTWNEGDYLFGEKFYRNWRVALKELYHYLNDIPKVPDGISLTEPNNIEAYFNKNN